METPKGSSKIFGNNAHKNNLSIWVELGDQSPLVQRIRWLLCLVFGVGSS